MSVANLIFQQCPSAPVASLYTLSPFSHSSPSLRGTVKFTVSCSSLVSPVTVLDGSVEKKVFERNEIRLGLPSKGRMASDTLDLLKVSSSLSLYKSIP